MEQVIMRPFSTTTYSLKEVAKKLRCSDTKVGRLVALYYGGANTIVRFVFVVS